MHSASMNIFGRVSTLTGRVVQTFEDSVTRDFPDSLYRAVFKVVFDLPEGASPAPGLVPVGYRDQGRGERQRRRRERRDWPCRATTKRSWKPVR